MESQNEDNLRNSIAELADQCRRSFQTCTQNQALMQHEWAENRLAEFKLWAAGTGVFAGDKTSLDARLAVNLETKNLITSILILLIDCIEKCKKSVTWSQDAAFEETHRRDSQDISTSIGSQVVSDPIPRAFSPWSEPFSTDSEPEEEFNLPVANTSTLQSTKGEVEQIIDYLSRLAVAVRKSGMKSRYQKADQLFKREDYQDLSQHLTVVVLSRGSREGREQYDVDPGSLSPIQERLVESNLRRRNRFQYAQSHSQKLAFDVTNPSNTFEIPLSENPILLNSEDDKVSLARLDGMLTTNEQSGPHSRGPHRPTAITATSASAVGTTIEAVPQYAPTRSQIAKTNITSISAKVDYPRPPRLQEGRRYFRCPCCCQTLPNMFRLEKQWKKHLAGDICPYTCFVENCKFPERLYVNRKDWLQHIEKDHLRCWECLPCQRRDQIPLLFMEEEEFLTHTKVNHGDSITEDQHPTLIRAAARPAPFGITRCPLCDQTGPTDSDELLDHIAEHVHSFSLRSLPWPGEEPDTHGNKPNSLDRDYFADGSDCQSYKDNVLSDSTKDTDGLASLPSNASLSRRSFFTEIDETFVELPKALKPSTEANDSNSPSLTQSPLETLPGIKPSNSLQDHLPERTPADQRLPTEDAPLDDEPSIVSTPQRRNSQTEQQISLGNVPDNATNIDNGSESSSEKHGEEQDPSVPSPRSSIERGIRPGSASSQGSERLIHANKEEVHLQIIDLTERCRDPDFRKRPKYSEVVDIMRKLDDLNSKPAGTVDLENEIKRHEDWIRRGKKLFGKSNAPLHIFKSHLEYVLGQNTSCFDTDYDIPRYIGEPGEPILKEASPEVGLSRRDDQSGQVSCICRKIEAGMMVQCQLCYEWYHDKCLEPKCSWDDKYTCPICDWRMKIPRDAARPKLEDLIALADEIPSLPFQPEEEEILQQIIDNAQTFRNEIAQYCNPLLSTEAEAETQRFFLRKLEGAEILLTYETNFLRQELHKWCPVAPEAPPILSEANIPTKLQKMLAEYGVNNADDLPGFNR